jgi:LysM repeat protein
MTTPFNLWTGTKENGMAIDPKWKSTINQSINDPKWDKYDDVIKAEVDAYALQFKALASKVNWLIIKAMLWSESGGPTNSAWNTRPLQIGNAGDPAYAVLQNGTEGSDLIMSNNLKTSIAAGSINTPEVNIKAGIAYLYTRMSITNIISVRNLQDSKEYEYTVSAGDSLEKISNKVNTTVHELRRLNPKSSGILRVGQKLRYVKAKLQRSIINWREFSADVVADRYNGGGDINYSAKLTFILEEVFPKLERKK